LPAHLQTSWKSGSDPASFGFFPVATVVFSSVGALVFSSTSSSSPSSTKAGFCGNDHDRLMGRVTAGHTSRAAVSRALFALFVTGCGGFDAGRISVSPLEWVAAVSTSEPTSFKAYLSEESSRTVPDDFRLEEILYCCFFVEEPLADWLGDLWMTREPKAGKRFS
jgi:hypothetical protein